MIASTIHYDRKRKKDACPMDKPLTNEHEYKNIG